MVVNMLPYTTKVTLKMDIVRCQDGSYYVNNPTQICYRKEDATKLTWDEAEKIRDAYKRNLNRNAIVEPA